MSIDIRLSGGYLVSLACTLSSTGYRKLNPTFDRYGVILLKRLPSYPYYARPAPHSCEGRWLGTGQVNIRASR
jgi:hypothetical protein